MKNDVRFLSVGSLFLAIAVGCVGEEPKITGSTTGTGSCLTAQGRWKVSGSGCSAIDTTCTITQTQCEASLTCDDGTHSTSTVNVAGSYVTFAGVSPAGTPISCSVTLSGGAFSGSCSVQGNTAGSAPCNITGTFLGGISGSGGAGNSGGGPGAGGASSGGSGTGGDVGSGGVVGTGGGPPTTCTIKPNTASCQACFSAQCGDVCVACEGDTQCNTAIQCYVNCTTGNCPCTAGLTDPTSQQHFTDLGNCLSTTCGAACGGTQPPTGAVGDPCTASTDCTATGATCNGNWCTLQCAVDADCGANSSGVLNYCIPANSGANLCFPGCKIDADCASYPNTVCLPYSGTVSVCSLPAAAASAP